MWELEKCIIIAIISHLMLVESSVFVTDNKMNKMIELNSRKPYCRLHTDRGNIQSTVLNTNSLKIRQVPDETIRMLEQVCFDGQQLSQEIQGGLSFIYPGTLWCGPGSIAKNYSDIGRHAEEDKCCRAHDNCHPQIAPGQCLRSICNHGTFTRVHCDCDEKFRRCLSGLNTEIANTLGATFFNAVQVTCFDTRRPCSNLQSSSGNCELKFYRSPAYKFHQTFESTESLPKAEALTSSNEFGQRRSLDNHSINLILGAFYDNYIYRPLKSFANFVIVTKSIYYEPSVKIEGKYLIQ